MKITLLGLYDRGILSNERVHFRAEEDLNLSFFMVLDSFWADATQVQAGYRAGFWFRPQTIKNSQHVVVYSRAGSPSTETHSDGATYNFICRGSSAPIYSDPRSTAIVMEINTWISTAPAQDLGSILIGATLPQASPPTRILGDYIKGSMKK